MKFIEWVIGILALVVSAGIIFVVTTGAGLPR
jgi:hypothetical protein